MTCFCSCSAHMSDMSAASIAAIGAGASIWAMNEAMNVGRKNGKNMKLEIDVFDYLSPEKMTEIAEDEVRRAFRDQFRKEADVERVLSNLTAEYVFKLIESEWASHSVDFEKALRERIDSAIRDDSVKYYVFRRKDVWDRTESPAVKILDDECANSRPLIREMVEKHIREYPFHELDMDEIGCVIYDVIMDKILKRRANNDER